MLRKKNWGHMNPRLGDVCGGKDNNLNLIRIVAAAAVLVSHAYPLSLGPSATEPLKPMLGITLGTIAVYVFFAISGFLIARSFDRRERLADWFAARIMRLLPALLVVLLLTAFILGPLVTDMPIRAYFSEKGVVSYILRNLTLANLQYGLPGVFGNLPYPKAINGSLWTLFIEVQCYTAVLILGLLGFLRNQLWMTAAIIGYLALYVATELLFERESGLRNLSLPFVIGMMLYCWRIWAPLSWWISGGLAALTILLHGTSVFGISFALWICYTVFVVAYLLDGRVRLYNKLGDYSYGLYIYAFPAQQLTTHFFNPMTPMQNMAIAFPVALLCAVLSWRWIEKPALNMRHQVADVFAGKLG